jgi:hypothetical protein
MKGKNIVIQRVMKSSAAYNGQHLLNNTKTYVFVDDKLPTM